MTAKNNTTIEEHYGTVEWKCDTCGKIKEYTPDESENAEVPRPNTDPEDLDYYVPCTFCKKGQMLPPTFTSFAEAFESILECDE